MQIIGNDTYVPVQDGARAVALATASRPDLLGKLQRLGRRFAELNAADSSVYHETSEDAIAWRAIDLAVSAAGGRGADLLVELESGLTVVDADLRALEQRLLGVG